MVCPKCGSNQIWIETEQCSDWLRCRCGLMKLVKRVDGDLVIIHRTAEELITLPSRGSKLHDVLMVVASFPTVQTVEVAHTVGESIKKVASTLVWKLTKAAKRLLEVS